MGLASIFAHSRSFHSTNNFASVACELVKIFISKLVPIWVDHSILIPLSYERCGFMSYLYSYAEILLFTSQNWIQCGRNLNKRLQCTLIFAIFLVCVCVLISYCNELEIIMIHLMSRISRNVKIYTDLGIPSGSRAGALNVPCNIWCWPAPSQNDGPWILTQCYLGWLWSNKRVKQ